MPEYLSADMYNEVTLVVDSVHFTSLVNLVGPAKNGRQDYANAWSIIEAICLAFIGKVTDSDPVCNIISANVAAGWVEMEQQDAAKIIRDHGSAHLKYLGNQGYQYRFIDFVYNEFVR